MGLLVPFLASSSLLLAANAVTLITFHDSLKQPDLICEWSGTAPWCSGECDASAGAFSHIVEDKLKAWMTTFPDVHVVRNDTGTLAALAWRFESEFGGSCWLAGYKAFCCQERSIFTEKTSSLAYNVAITGHYAVREADDEGVLRSVKAALPHWAVNWNRNNGGIAFPRKIEDSVGKIVY